ncbi:D-glycerate dehydrogenase [Vibrio sp.]|uniref:D-glycerate dehydrogenase n=1 Tax=Vibrio viridaestus TaxID=2487322 RepID=A0A3N9U605_9VIBR|nr:D-glycerate dehydrogenase [Vibrio viridaestus]MDC0612468.1 D-glycerate dehydrogenase [Vibrio sp.]RQW63496.1 D-glycerate dehydrogenase [Vibrio viridaestus]
MKKRVLVYKDLPATELSKLEQRYEVKVIDNATANQEEFVTAFRCSHGAIGSGAIIDSALISSAPDLQALSTISVGVDQFDIAALNERGIPLMHTPDVLTETTADTTFMLMMCAARRAVELSNYILRGDWKSGIGEELYGLNVAGKSVGIIGMGRIGSAVAKRAKLGFNMPVYYHNRSRNDQTEAELDATWLPLEQLFKQCDFVVSLLPATEETFHLIGAREFALMKSSAVFINVGRGTVVDEKALVDALLSKEIAAAGLDVFEVEPLPETSPLMSIPNAVLLPHIGSATHETRHAMAVCATDNLIAALDGNIEKNCANGSNLKAN